MPHDAESWERCPGAVRNSRTNPHLGAAVPLAGIHIWMRLLDTTAIRCKACGQAPPPDHYDDVERGLARVERANAEAERQRRALRRERREHPGGERLL